MKKGSWLFLMLVFFCIAFLPKSVHAEAIKVESTQNVETLASSSNLDITPVENGQFKNGMQRASTDLTELGQSLSVPIFLISLFLGVIFLILGIFSKKLLAAGGISLVIAGIAFFILGDPMKIVNIAQNVLENVRTYF